eukprot:6173121-Pleurochrysis_carterae.AAC.2
MQEGIVIVADGMQYPKVVARLAHSVDHFDTPVNTLRATQTPSRSAKTATAQSSISCRMHHVADSRTPKGQLAHIGERLANCRGKEAVLACQSVRGLQGLALPTQRAMLRCSCIARHGVCVWLMELDTIDLRRRSDSLSEFLGAEAARRVLLRCPRLLTHSLDETLGLKVDELAVLLPGADIRRVITRAPTLLQAKHTS